MPAEVSAQIVAKTDGVPLFVEELTKTVLESGLLTDAGDHYELSGPLPPLAIPATLHDSLMARLDRLAPVKEIAQLGAVIGHEFSQELLAAVVDWPEDQLCPALDQLVASELVFRRGVPPDAVYSFKHTMVQDVAYQSLLKSRREQLHSRIAQVLEERFPETAETQPELLAQHYTAAGLHDQAVDYWHRAGQRASERSANLEAIAHLTRGVELARKLPDPMQSARQELKLSGRSWRTARRREGSRDSRGGSHVQPCPGAVQTGGRNAPPVPDDVGALALLPESRRVPDGPRAR